MEDAQLLPHVVILPSPGMGHLIPLAELAKRLVLNHNFSVTLIFLSIDSYPKSQKSILDALPKAVTPILLPPIPSNQFPENSIVEERIGLAVVRSLPSLRDILKNSSSTNRVVTLVVDIFGIVAFEVAREFNVTPYMFYTTSLMVLSFGLYLPTLDAAHACDFRDLNEPVKIPGCTPVHGKELPETVQDRSNESYSVCLRVYKSLKEVKAILVNSFVDLEPEAVKAMKEDSSNPPIYTVGPLVLAGSTNGVEGAECLRWLDEQPRGSVLFVCFGSGGTLSQEQMTELAWGLEMSGERFMWVARSPHDKETSATFFSGQSMEDPFDFLPNGFLEDTKGRGLVVPSWAPQIEVLSHGSTGGFLSHCGWNSILECIINGVPMIAWPLYAEQKMNAVMLVEDLKVAVRPRAGEKEKGLVGREDIAQVIKDLMEGEEGKKLHKRAQELKDKCAMAWKEDGSSYRNMREVAQDWSNLEL